MWTRNAYLLDTSACSVLCEKLAHPCNLIMCEKLMYLKCSLVIHGCCFYWCGTSMLCSLEAGTVLSGVFGKYNVTLYCIAVHVNLLFNMFGIGIFRSTKLEFHSGLCNAPIFGSIEVLNIFIYILIFIIINKI